MKTAVVTAASGTGGASPGAVLNASGYVTARRRATVSSKVTGKVLEVFIEEGKAVKKGQVLARLDDSQIRAAMAVAQAQLMSARGAAAEDEARLREAERQYNRLNQLVQEKVVGRAEVDTAQSSVESLKARIALAKHAGRSRAVAGRGARGRPRRHGGPRAVRRRRDLEGRAAGRDDLAGFSRRRFHAHRHLHDRRHVVARNRSRRQRELHQSGQAESAGRGDSRCLSRLADSGARDYDRADRRPAEGDGARAHRLRGARAEDPAGHGRQGVVLQREAGGSEARRCAAQTAAAGAESRRAHRGQRRASFSSCARTAPSGAR